MTDTLTGSRIVNGMALPPAYPHPYLRPTCLIRALVTERWALTDWPESKRLLRKAMALRAIVVRGAEWN